MSSSVGVGSAMVDVMSPDSISTASPLDLFFEVARLRGVVGVAGVLFTFLPSGTDIKLIRTSTDRSNHGSAVLE